MNDAAGDICVQNPIMLSVRGELLELARKRVNDSGYKYKNVKSRSKRFGSASSVEASELQRQQHALEMELQCLEKKEKKSKWYQKQKVTRKRALSPLSSDSESSVTPLLPQSSILQNVSTPASSPSSSLSHGLHNQRRSLSTPPQLISRQSGGTVDLTRQNSGDTVILSGEIEVGDDFFSSSDPSF